MRTFSVAGGSVPGTDHTKPGQPGWVNNQDAFDFISDSTFLVGAVCDGCGGSRMSDDGESSAVPFSEVGARLGARMAVTAVSRYIRSGRRVGADGGNELCAHVLEDMKGQVSACARVLAGDNTPSSFIAMILRYFLFTTLIVAMDEESTVVITLGDGIYAYNGLVTQIGPYNGNQPPYLAYHLASSMLAEKDIAPQVRVAVPTFEVESVLLGTDGAIDLVAAADTEMPIIGKPVGPLSQFWEEARFTEHPDAIRRHLAMVNREWARDGVVKRGLLHDDTTLLVVRRVAEET